MLNFILNALFWTFALYGLFEIIRNIMYKYIYTESNKNNTYLIIAVKNGEDYIEGSIRNDLSKIFLDNKNPIREIMVVDLNSNDSTNEILSKMKEKNKNIKIINWNECKDIIDKECTTNS
ncbi:MAG: glycosyltransferase [Clostridia bacterium]|nr:glycosyltransferase [Clostridia bacterium]